MKSGAAVIGFVFSAGIGLAVGYSIRASKEGPQPAEKIGIKDSGAKPAAAPVATGEEIYKVPIGTSAQKGPADALVTVVEFSDFQCPFCSRVVPTIKQLQDEYSGRLRVVFKHNPLPFHKDAPLASEWALGANEQGKFWEFHDTLFNNQQALSEADLERHATSLGLDVSKIRAFVAGGAGKKQIADDQAISNRVGARGTPAFFINGVKLSGAQPYASFKKVVDEQLAKAQKLVDSGVAKSAVYEKIMVTARDSAPAEGADRPQPPPQTRQNVELVASSPTKGPNAPLVTIVEWSDFECPFCKRAIPTVNQISDAYGDKVAIQFRHQPLSFHKSAMPSAKAAVAAHKQGKFWEMHDALFNGSPALSAEDLDRYARQIGLDMNRFKADMEDAQTQAMIQKDMDDGAKYGARGTPTFFVNGVPVRGAQPFESFKVVIDKEIELANKLIAEGVSKSNVYQEVLKREAGKAIAQAAPTGAPPTPTGPVNIDLGRAPLKGDPKAPIKVIVFSDFECPFCSRVEPSLKQLEQEYGKKVAFAFKHYPLPFHSKAELAGVASLAAHKQGKFWPMHDKLFENQKALDRPNLLEYAKQLGLDMGKFEKDLEDPELKAWMKADMEQGTKVGVRGTPATFVNGILVSGAQPYENFKRIVEEELKKKG
ncbi:MAG: thioredoxin domain-containing protein [Deltaproteobacteria bacterium]|nr:thioredoxin domain-containing protein [Deltaproteobacteria bacterium]